MFNIIRNFSNFYNELNFEESYYNYLVNDPSVSIRENVKITKPEILKLSITGLSKDTRSEKSQRALNSYITLTNSINYIQKNSKSPIKSWALPQTLLVSPEAGRDLNAYYDRRSLRFFYYPVGKETIYTSDSSDIVSHELGHAILDATRPDFWNVQSLEIWSFHEAFSDICSMINSMQYDSCINYALNETNNDLHKSNVISRVGEQIGILIYKISKNNKQYLEKSLRDTAIEKYKYINPTKLPKNGKNNELLAECHSFGRVFSAAWYEIFVEIFEREFSKNKNALQSVKNSRDICFKALLYGVSDSPKVNNYYSSLALLMINNIKNKSSEYYDVAKNIFENYNIINNNLKILSNTQYKDIIYKLKKQDKVVKNKNFTTFNIVENKKIKINLNTFSILSFNKINEVEIDVPADKFYCFDEKNNLIFETNEDENSIKESVSICIESVEKSLYSDKMWSVKNNKVVRNYII
jgi:hypothetical protein